MTKLCTHTSPGVTISVFSGLDKLCRGSLTYLPSIAQVYFFILYFALVNSQNDRTISDDLSNPICPFAPRAHRYSCFKSFLEK